MRPRRSAGQLANERWLRHPVREWRGPARTVRIWTWTRPGDCGSTLFELLYDGPVKRPGRAVLRVYPRAVLGVPSRGTVVEGVTLERVGGLVYRTPAALAPDVHERPVA
jgi:hypothetical protein